MSNCMLLQVHFNSQGTWALQRQHKADVCCRFHASYLLMWKKSDCRRVLLQYYVKLCRAVVKMCVQNLFVCECVVIGEAAVTWRGAEEGGREQTNTGFASSTHTGPFSCRFTFSFLLKRVTSYSAAQLICSSTVSFNKQCVKWIRPDEVSPNVSLPTPSGGMSLVFTKDAALQMTVTQHAEDWAASVQVWCHKQTSPSVCESTFKKEREKKKDVSIVEWFWTVQFNSNFFFSQILKDCRVVWISLFYQVEFSVLMKEGINLFTHSWHYYQCAGFYKKDP